MEGEQYSRRIAIGHNGLAQPLSAEVYPNPIEDHAVKFQWYSQGPEDDVKITVRDLRGVTLHVEPLDYATRGLEKAIKLRSTCMQAFTSSRYRMATQCKPSSLWWSNIIAG